MKKTLAFVFFLGIKFYAIGQLKNVSLSFSGNVPIIQSASKSSKIDIPPYLGTAGTTPIALNTTFTVKESYQPKAGFNFSFKADYSITSKFFFSSGLTLNYYRFNQKSMVYYEGTQPSGTTANGVPNGSFSITRDNVLVDFRSPKTDKSCIYLTLPILAGKSFYNEKLIVRAGASCSYILDAYGYQLNFTSDLNSIEEKKKTQTSMYNAFLINAVVESTYKITNRIGIDLSIQKSFTPIYKEANRLSGKPAYNTISLGVSYSLLKK